MEFFKSVFGGGKDLLSKFDKFASPYNAPKQTNKGAIASLVIHMFSFGYFAFMAYQFGSNQIEPAFAFVNLMNFSEHSIDLTKDLFAFQYFLGTDGSLENVQQQNNLIYLLFEVHFYDHATKKNINVPYIKCKSHPDVEAYYCPDFQSVKGDDGKNLHLITLKQPKTEVVLTAKRCTGLSNCATTAQIDDLLSQQSYFDIVAFGQQYNHISMKFETVYMQETYYFDTDLAINSKIKVITAKTNVYDGAFVSTKTMSNNGPYDYTRLDQYNSQKILTLEKNANLLLYLSFDLDTFSVKLDIQFPTLMSLVPVAISLGEIVYVILRFILPDFSKDALSKVVMKANLKEHYSKAAHQILQKNNQNSGSEKPLNEDQKDKEEQKQIQPKNDPFENFKKLQSQQDSIIELIQQGLSGNFSNLFKKLLPCLKRQQSNNNLSQYKDKFQALQNKSSPEEDLSASIQDVLFLKKAIKLLLTKEQYAAVHFCGADIKLEDEIITKKSSYNGQASPQTVVPMESMNQKYEKTNHLESIDSIESSNDELMKVFKNYIQKKDAKISELDKRIHDSLIFDFNTSKETEDGSGSPGGSPNLLSLAPKLGKMTSDFVQTLVQHNQQDIVGEVTDLLNN